MPKSTIDVNLLAQAFNKPVSFTNAMIEKHGVTFIPSTRQAGDGLDAFYSDMSSSYNDQPSLTKQEFTESCDPNYILDRHSRGLDISLTGTPVYRDVSDMPSDYHTALNLVTQANQSFMKLDAKIRAKFDNDPGQFVDFITNPENAQAVFDMGLAVARPFESSVEAPAAKNAVSKDGGGEGA